MATPIKPNQPAPAFRFTGDSIRYRVDEAEALVPLLKFAQGWRLDADVQSVQSGHELIIDIPWENLPLPDAIEFLLMAWELGDPGRMEQTVTTSLSAALSRVSQLR